MLVCFRYLEFALLGGKCFSEPFYSLLCLHNPLIRAARRQKLEQSCQFWGVIWLGSGQIFYCSAQFLLVGFILSNRLGEFARNIIHLICDSMAANIHIS